MNIIVADDEQIILKWMKKNIEELPGDNRVLGICTNGKQVLNYCLDQKVDVLFTDIRMPVMGGIELLQKLVDNHVMPYTIILSAHDDFSYARDCFKLGVREFLLKSEITKEKLEKCIRTAAAHLKSAQMEEPVELSEEEQWEAILGEYFCQEEERFPGDIKEQWNTLCRIKGEFLVIKIAGFSRTFQAQRFRELASFLFQEEDLTFYCVPKADKEIVILSECPHESVKRFVIRLYHVLESFGYRDIRMSASDRGQTSEGLETAYLQTEEVFRYQSFYKQYGGMDYVSMKSQVDAAGRELKDGFRNLEEKIDAQNWKELVLGVRELFLLIKTVKPAVLEARQFVLNYLFHIYWNYLAEEKEDNFSVSTFIELSSCTDIGNLEERSIGQTEQFIAMLEEKQHFYSEPVREMIRYMEGRYETAISLDELSSHVHMNRSYVSHLFKKETGINIYQYLLELRLDEAKLLLMDSKYSIQEVCRRVGISDSAYFSKLFKKHVGTSPLEFRKAKNKR